MQIVINTFGTYITKEGDCFLIKMQDKKQSISYKKVSQIMITTAASISTDAIKMAVDNNIDILFLDKYGNPYGRIWHTKLGSTVMIRRNQLLYSFDERGLNLAKEWITKKFTNQIDFFQKLHKYREGKGDYILKSIESLKQSIEKINNLEGTIDEKRNTIMGIEGSCGKVYFNALNKVMPQKYKFKGRSRMPAKDPFNAMLNYGYGVLYSMVEKACIIAGLDPYVGFIHADNYNKKSLVFDIIEMFRTYNDKVVVYQFTQKKVNDSYFDEIKNGFTLNDEGKKFFIENFNKYFEKTIRYNNRNIKLRDTIQFECHKIAQSLIKGE